ISTTALPEEEVVSDHNMADVQGPDQHLLDKLRGRKPRQIGIERQHDGEIEPEALDQAQLLLKRRQPEVRLIRAEELPRVRLENHDPGRLPGCATPLQCFKQKRLMAAMHAIEIADGERPAEKLGRYVPVAVKNAHAVPIRSNVPA